MECDVTGQPKPNITWLFSGKQFTGTATSRISIESNRLVFDVIYGGDIGVYQCVADNGREMVQSSAVLITAGVCTRKASCSLTSIGIVGRALYSANGREKINRNKYLNVQMEEYAFAQIPKKSGNHQKHVRLKGLFLIFSFK